MAINNGNHSFMLTTVQMDTRTLQVSWYDSNSKASGANPIKLTVTRPGDYNIIFSKEYTSGEINDIFRVTVPFQGEYNVHISTNRGYTYDYKNVMMMVRDTFVDTKVFTKSDLNQIKLGQVITHIVGAALPVGGAALMTLRFGTKLIQGQRAIGSVLFSLGIGNIFLRETTTVSFPQITENDKIKTTLRHLGDSYEISVVYEQTVDANGNGGAIYNLRNETFKYLKFER